MSELVVTDRDSRVLGRSAYEMGQATATILLEETGRPARVLLDGVPFAVTPDCREVLEGGTATLRLAMAEIFEMKAAYAAGTIDATGRPVS